MTKSELPPERPGDSNRSLWIVRHETPADVSAVHELHRQAFGQELEAQLVDALRAEGFATLSLVAEAESLLAEREDEVVGHVLFSPLEIVSETTKVRALALAPVGVLPAWQGQGIGSAVIRVGLELAKRAGEQIVVVLGEPAYYRRFGFRQDLTTALASPYAGEYFMALELIPGALAGVAGDVRYAAPFARLG